MRSHRRGSARAVRLAALFAAACLALASSAGPSLALSSPSTGTAAASAPRVDIGVDVGVDVGVDWTRSLEIDPCPPRCSARLYARLKPSDVYEPVEPDEWIFDSESQVVWGHDESQFWLIWGGSDVKRIVLWDDTMWAEPADSIGIWGGYASTGRASSASEVWTPYRKTPGAGGGASAPRIRFTVFGGPARDAPQDLELPDQPPTTVWEQGTRSQLVALLQRISKSRYAVAGLTLGIVWLMLRLVR